MAIEVSIVKDFEAGINKEDLEESLQILSDQIRRIDQKVTTTVDDEIWRDFQDQRGKVNDTMLLIKKTYKVEKI